MTTHWPDNVKPGRRVRATSKHAAIIIEFTVAEIDYDGELIPNPVDKLTISGIYPVDFTVEVISDPLPTEPGLYVPTGASPDSIAYGRVFALDSHGWRETPAPVRTRTLDDMRRLSEMWGGFVRLIPEGASE